MTPHLLNEQEFQRRTGYSSFAEMHRQFHGKLFGYVLKMTGNPSDTEDILQNTFMRIARYVSTNFEPGTNFNAWVYRITSTQTLNYLRQRTLMKKRNESLDDLSDCVAELADHKTPPPDQDSLEALWAERSKELKPEFKETFGLVVLEGLPYEEIAERLQIPKGTVMSRVYRARRALGVKLNHRKGRKSAGERE